MAYRTNSSITEEDKNFVETWENISPGTVGVVRLDARGDVRHEMINGRRTFIITSEERMITQDRIVVRELDPFTNGSFRPVVVPDSVTVESNPNALSDDEIDNILQASELAWTEWLGNIDSVATLRRMMDRAEAADITLSRFRQIEERLVEARPLSRIETNDPQLQAFLDPERRTPAPVNTTASGASNPRRNQGGRSADYR